MALRLASSRALAGLRTSSALSRATYATTPATRPPPEEKAKSVIDALPGNNIVTKTGIITLGTGAAAFAVSKEIYVFNAETIVMASFIGIAAIIYRSLKEPIKEYTDSQIDRIMGILTKARADHRVAVQEKIGSVGQMSDIVDVTRTLFQMSREMTELEARAYELKQRTAYVGDIKNTLDGWVRYEASVREREQKKVAALVMEELTKRLADPKVQQDILNQSIAEIQALAKKA
ncbi:atp4 subunit B of the stator stalk of mitochondrial F1F0 ATP synthase [Sorochytrium milnesiophthora]